jgi:phospholipid-translocating ATPase
MRSPDLDKEFILQTDASDRGVGAVLSQLDIDEQEHPVAYFSRKLLPRETRYATIEKECLAIKLATHAFRVYLLGRKFTIQTDHRALEWLHRLKDNNARLVRWSLALQPYNFQVRYRTGCANGNADALSLEHSPPKRRLRRKRRRKECEGPPVLLFLGTLGH